MFFPFYQHPCLDLHHGNMFIYSFMKLFVFTSCSFPLNCQIAKSAKRSAEIIGLFLVGFNSLFFWFFFHLRLYLLAMFAQRCQPRFPTSFSKFLKTKVTLETKCYIYSRLERQQLMSNSTSGTVSAVLL